MEVTLDPPRDLMAFNATLAKKLNDVQAERDALRKLLEENNSRESDALRDQLRQAHLERDHEHSERQRLEEKRDELQVMLRDTKMALARMEKEVEERSLQRSQADKLAERFEEERGEHREKVRGLEDEIQQWRERYEALIAEGDSEKEAATRRVKYIENQLQQASEKESELLSQISELLSQISELQSQISELQGIESEQNARLQEYYDHLREQENNMESLKSENASMRGHGGELKRANEEKKELKLKIEMDKKSLKEYADQCDIMIKDLERRDAMVTEAQRQQAECYRRLQQAEGEVAQLRMKLEAVNKRLEEVENEKAHMDVQLCVYVKDFEVERSAREKQAEMIDNLQKKLAESKGDTNTLRREINRQSSIIRKFEEERESLGMMDTMPSGGSMDPQGGNMDFRGGDPRDERTRMQGRVDTSVVSPPMSAQGPKKTFWDTSARPQAQDWRAGYTMDHERGGGGGGVFSPKAESFEGSLVGQRRIPSTDEEPPRREMMPEGQRGPILGGAACPICRRGGFHSMDELQRHSATCTDFPGA